MDKNILNIKMKMDPHEELYLKTKCVPVYENEQAVKEHCGHQRFKKSCPNVTKIDK